jgi:hypothetical protein
MAAFIRSLTVAVHWDGAVRFRNDASQQWTRARD